MTNTNSTAEKLGALINEPIERAVERIIRHIDAGNEELLINMKKLEARQDIMEQLVIKSGSMKKPRTTRDTPAPVTVKEVDAELQVGAREPFKTNKLLFFKDQCKNNEEFRNKYITEELRRFAESQPPACNKTGAQKEVAIYTYVWNYMKSDAGRPVYTQFEKDHITAKEAYEAALKQPQQTVEPGSP